MAYLTIYLVAALLTLQNDALCCYSVGRKFKFKASLVCSLFWFISVPLAIVAVHKETGDKSNG